MRFPLLIAATSPRYGESSKNLAEVFDACEELGAVIFIDEVDSLATSRNSGDMHEATRRLLSVVLQRVEGLEGASKSTLVCATNRRQDLDPALLSRFDLQLNFQVRACSRGSGAWRHRASRAVQPLPPPKTTHLDLPNRTTHQPRPISYRMRKRGARSLDGTPSS